MKDLFTKKWIIENSIQICNDYEFGVLTLRSLHYQLVGIGMTNDLNHYKRVVGAMIEARWNGDIAFEQFSDLDREMVGESKFQPTSVQAKSEEAKTQVRLWMTSYSKNRWENQMVVPEVLIEKKALQGVFVPICRKLGVALGACKGYPSLTFLNDIAARYSDVIAHGKQPIILYFGDYDPSGEDIPRSIVENLLKFDIEVELERIGLLEDQVINLNLPPAPTKLTDTRSGKWNGLGQVELDAVKPEMLQQWCSDAIHNVFDKDLYQELNKIEKDEEITFRKILKEFVSKL